MAKVRKFGAGGGVAPAIAPTGQPGKAGGGKVMPVNYRVGGIRKALGVPGQSPVQNYGPGSGGAPGMTPLPRQLPAPPDPTPPTVGDPISAFQPRNAGATEWDGGMNYQVDDPASQGVAVYAKGGSVRRRDGCAIRGKTRA